jgi:hypothetical protein
MGMDISQERDGSWRVAPMRTYQWGFGKRAFARGIFDCAWIMGYNAYS